jgi:hypothetical protein
MSTLLSFEVGVVEGRGTEEIVEEGGRTEIWLATRGIGAFGAAGDAVDRLDCFDEDDDEPPWVDAKEDVLPFTGGLAAGTDLKDLTVSGFMGGGATEAGEEDKGAAASSIEPKVTEEPAE